MGCDSQLASAENVRGSLSAANFSGEGNIWGICPVWEGLGWNVWICMQDYRCLCVVVMICATHRQTAF